MGGSKLIGHLFRFPYIISLNPSAYSVCSVVNHLLFPSVNRKEDHAFESAFL